MKEKYTVDGNLIKPNFRPNEAPSALERSKKTDGDALIIAYDKQEKKAVTKLERLNVMRDADEDFSVISPGELMGLIIRFRDVLESGNQVYRAYIEARVTHGDENEDTVKAYNDLQMAWFALENVLKDAQYIN